MSGDWFRLAHGRTSLTSEDGADLGVEPFRRLLNDPRFAHLPMLIETEKTESRTRGKGLVDVDPLDEMNLNTLRGLRDL